MEDIKIIVENKVASVEGTPFIVCGNNDYTLSFTFDKEWNDEQDKVARFGFIKNGLKSFIDVPIQDDKCNVPVMLGIGLVRVGVYAGELKTTTGAKIGCIKSILCDDADEMDEPYINIYNELLKKIEEMGGISLNIIQSLDLDLETEYGENDVPSAQSVINALVVMAELFATNDYVDGVEKSVKTLETRLATHIEHQNTTNSGFIETHNALIRRLDALEEDLGGIENGSY